MIKHWKAARDEGEDKSEEARFLMSEFSEWKSRGAKEQRTKSSSYQSSFLAEFEFEFEITCG